MGDLPLHAYDRIRLAMEHSEMTSRQNMRSPENDDGAERHRVQVKNSGKHILEKMQNSEVQFMKNIDLIMSAETPNRAAMGAEAGLRCHRKGCKIIR